MSKKWEQLLHVFYLHFSSHCCLSSWDFSFPSLTACRKTGILLLLFIIVVSSEALVSRLQVDSDGSANRYRECKQQISKQLFVQSPIRTELFTFLVLLSPGYPLAQGTFLRFISLSTSSPHNLALNVASLYYPPIIYPLNINFFFLSIDCKICWVRVCILRRKVVNYRDSAEQST